MENKLKLFFITSRFPFPLTKGDKLRAFHQVKGLANDFDIYLCTLTDEKVKKEYVEALRPYCKEILVLKLPILSIIINVIRFLLFTGKPVQTGYFYSRRLNSRISNHLSRIKPDRIYCQLVRTAAYDLSSCEVPRTLDFMDALSAGMERRAESSSFLFRWLFKMESGRLKKFEHHAFRNFDQAVIISESDRDLIFHFSNEEIAVVPNGVDLQYFRNEANTIKWDLLFTGNMSYPPNIISARYLVKEIMPLIWSRRPQTKLLIAGANPSRKVKSLAGNNVTVQGWLDDIRTAYNTSEVFIAPMLIGSGLQNKLLEAMAMKKPCISSDLANRSLGAEEGKAILIGRSPEQYADHALALLENKANAAELAEKGHSFVAGHFSWPISNAYLSEILRNGKVKKGN